MPHQKAQLSIYLIEDDEDDKVLVTDLLKRIFGDRLNLTWNADPWSWMGTREALQADLFIVDYYLGEATAVEVVKELQAKHPTTPAIVLTGAGESDLDIATASSGASDFMDKGDLNHKILDRSIRFALSHAAFQNAKLAHQAEIEGILATSEMALWSYAPDRPNAFFVSESILLLTGYPARAFLEDASLWANRVHPEDVHLATPMNAWEDSIDHGIPRHYRWQRRDGHYIWIQEQVYRNSKSDTESSLEVILKDHTTSINRTQKLTILEASVEQATDAVLITDAKIELPGPKIIFVNDAMCQMTGYAREELIGQTPRILQGPKTKIGVIKSLKDALINKVLWKSQTWNYRKDGTAYLVEWSVTPLYDDRDHLSHFLSVQRNITERYYTERQLRNNEALLTATSSIAKVGGWSYDVDQDALAWTDEVWNIYGLEKGVELSVEKALKVYESEEQKSIQQVFERCVETGKAYSMMSTITDCKGVRKVVKHSGNGILEDGKVVRVVGAIQDVTEDYNLRIRNESFANLAVEIVATLSRQLDIVSINKRVNDVLGFTPNQLLGYTFLLIIDDDDKAIAYEQLKSTFEQKEVVQLKLRVLTSTGESRIISWNAVSEASSGQILLIGRDITEATENRRRLEKALADAQLANESKNQFLMTMSHELRTPLNPAIGFTSIMLEEPGRSESDKDMLQTILDSSEHLISLIEDLLEFTQLDANRAKFVVDEFDLLEAIQKVINIMQPKAMEKHLEISLLRSSKLAFAKEININADSGKIRQVLINLLSNAVKFTDEGDITIKLDCKSNEDDHSQWEIAVIDTGIGIPEAKQKAIFEPFQQVDSGLSREYGGVGIGLALCQRIAHMLEGDLAVESVEGKGSCFRFNFKTSPAKVATKKPPTDQSSISDTIKLPTKSILLVEDEEWNQKFMQVLLTQENMKVTLAVNGAEAVEHCKHTAFDVILMDLSMPVMDGVAATKTIRNEPNRNSKTPIIALTAQVDANTAQKSLAAGCNNFLTKPVQRNPLLTAIQEVT